MASLRNEGQGEIQWGMRPASGSELRDRGIASASSNDADWQAHAKEVMSGLAGTGMPFSTDQFHDLLKFQPRHHNAIGGVFRWARKQGMIQKVSTMESVRPSAHSRLIWVYRGVLDK